MDEKKLNFVTNETTSLVNIMRNLPITDSAVKLEIAKVLFLDLYFKKNINFEFKIFEAEKEFISNNLEKYNELICKYKYALGNNGVFYNKSAAAKGISDTASLILRRVGIQCNTISGHIKIKEGIKDVYYRHFWNEIKINNVWYIYDFTFNLISYKYRENEYKELLKFIKVPITPIDYAFIKRQSNNVKLGGYNIPKRGPISQDLNQLSDDFSKYSNLDRSRLLNIYLLIEKLYKSSKI